MSESASSLTELVSKPSYEEIRDKYPDGAVREMWRAGDDDVARMREEIERIQDDETLSEEGKAQKIAYVRDRYVPAAQQHYADAREKARQRANSAYEFSIPLPDKGTFATSRAKDSGELVAIQNEAERIVQKVSGKSLQQMTKEVSRNPRDRGMQDAAGGQVKALREEYMRAMDLGGLEGKVLAHATLRAADALGIDYDSVVDEFRNDRQRRYVREAQRQENDAYAIPTGRNLEAGLFAKKSRRRGGDHVYRSNNRVMVSGNDLSAVFRKKSSKRAWK